MDREILATLHWRKPGQHGDRWRPQRRDTAGEFQPSSLSPWDQTDDFHLWRNIVWQFSEEFQAVWLDHKVADAALRKGGPGALALSELDGAPTCNPPHGFLPGCALERQLSRRIFAVATAAIAASYPLSSAEPGRPARSSACSSESQVNDNMAAVDEFQPNLTVAASGTVSVNLYDRRLACPAAGTEEAVKAGLGLDTTNPKSPGTIPYGATNYCVNASAQLYGPTLTPIGHNIRLTPHRWDPQLNSLRPGRPRVLGFIGDYFGNLFGGKTGTIDHATFLSTFDDGTNPEHRQQQVVAGLRLTQQTTSRDTRVARSGRVPSRTARPPREELFGYSAHRIRLSRGGSRKPRKE